MTPNATSRRIDWKVERDRIDLAAVARDLISGEPRHQGRKLLFLCPFHDDHSPSLVVDPDRRRWKCFPCGIGGDALELVKLCKGMTFPEALAYLTGPPAPSGTARPRHRPEAARPAPKPSRPPAGPSGMPEAEALALVAEAEARLWTPEGSEALAYLTGPRCLTLGTIRAARLGWTPRAAGVAWKPRGIVIPWREGDRLARVKVRPDDVWRMSFPEDRQPKKYLEGFADRPMIYPSPRVIRPGRPLVIVEGEFDALLLGQELGDLAAVVTLGGTGSSKPEPDILGSMLAACPWFIATDTDPGGEKAAADWEWTRAVRIRPPEGKDWTDAAKAGVDLRRFWSDHLFPWRVLARQRWGPAVGDPEPGIIIDRPDPARRRLALEALGDGPDV